MSSIAACEEVEKATHPCPPSASMQCGISLVERSALKAFATGVKSLKRSFSLVVSSSSFRASALPWCKQMRQLTCSTSRVRGTHHQ